jgi:fluoroquinolone transport system permease protein
MPTFFTQLKWQFVLLHKNNIISISFAVTIIYGLVLYFLRGVGSMDKVLVSLILNDPSVIGYFFIGHAFYIEIKYQILSAVLVTPLSIHQLLISKVLALTLIGVICSLVLAVSVRGLDFNIIPFVIGSLGICLLSALLGIIVMTYASELLKFTMLSVPIFLAFINIPLLQYLGAMDAGLLKYLFPVQGSVDLIDYGVSGTAISFVYAYLSIIVLVPIFYWLAFLRFNYKIATGLV